MMRKTIAQIDFILNKDQLKNDYNEFKSLEKIAIKYNMSVNTVKKKMVEHKINYKTKVHKYICNHNLFSEDSEKTFYLAGFIAADGCVRIAKTNKGAKHINHRLVIALSEKDLEFLQTLRLALECENPIGFYENKLSKRNEKWSDAKIVKISITSKQMVEDLKRFNIVPKKTLIYDMPIWLINHPLIHHFLRGYIDGDGSFFILSAIENSNITFSLRGTISFLEKVKSIFDKNNIYTDAKPRLSNGIGQFSIHSNKGIDKIFNFLYRDFTLFLPRKYNIAKKAKEILSIKEEANFKIKQILEHKDPVEIITDRTSL
jgi:hypothetical protein